LLSLTFACATIYEPPEEPLTEEALAEAMETLRESEGRVELLEDGIVADIYVYEWRYAPRDDWHDRRDWRMGVDIGPETHKERRLVGPKRDVVLPYEAIRSVRAKSWPLWSGVELELADPWRHPDAGPVIIKARNEEHAQRLSDAIDRVRRARLPEPTPAAAPEAEAPAEPEPVEPEPDLETD